MRVPLSWLREYVPIEMPLDELAEKLSVAAAEVEGIESVEGVVRHFHPLMRNGA